MRNQEPVIDVSILASFIGEDPHIQSLMLQKFSEQARLITAQITASIARKSASEIGALAHKLKSSSRTIGAMQLAGLCERLEQAGKTADWSMLEKLLPEFMVVNLMVEENIRELLK